MTNRTDTISFCEVTKNFASMNVSEVGLTQGMLVLITASHREHSENLSSNTDESGFCGMNCAHLILESMCVLHNRVKTYWVNP